MTKEVLISLAGEIRQADEQTNTDSYSLEESGVELTVQGTYYRKNEKHYVLFEDRSIDPAQPVYTRLIFDGDYLDMKKSGYLESVMIFDRTRVTSSYYTTPYGKLLFGITTTRYQVAECETSIRVRLEYELSVNDEPVSGHRLKIHIRPLK